ncbi:O-antigen ligase family protein [Natronococcus roseus]|uniref:O-antigen ligase family protein n=1 Tax=Natronococcus roseus TaxID=1052014 RepID=UPI00374CAF82
MTNLQRLFWGESSATPSGPLSWPLLAVLAIVSSLTVTTIFLPRELGYVLTAGTLALVSVYGVLAATVLDTDLSLRIDAPFVVLLGGYWLGLVAHFYYAPHTELLEYIVVTPLAVGATVVVLPALIDGRRQAFTMALTLVAVALAVIGFVMLWQELQTSEELYERVGGSVMGIEGVSTGSIFHSTNTHGFAMMVGSLAALYTYLSRRGAVWLGALAICLLGFLSAEGDAAFVGFTAGLVLVLSGFDRRFGFLGIGLAVLGVYLAIRLGHVGEVMETTLLGSGNRVDRWVASLERLAQDPLLGIGFADTAEEIGESRGPHNSYIYPLLNVGLIAGGLYLGALVYALGKGIRTRWTPWTGFVVGTAVSILLYMVFESHFLGGLSVSSVLLGLFLGLLLYLPDGA